MTWNAAATNDCHYYPADIVFHAGLDHHHVANTAYPIAHELTMRSYRVRRKQVTAVLTRAWEDEDQLGLYVHIPFCESRCAFCEYTVVHPRYLHLMKLYVQLLVNEFTLCRQILETGAKKVIGFDIGGGTPAILSDRSIGTIIDVARRCFRLPQDLEISLETTPLIAACQPERLKSFYRLGVRRLSMGIQATSPAILKAMDRSWGSFRINARAVDNIRNAGFGKFNIDLMYGLANLELPDWEKTVRHAVSLSPDYITLYRTRYKGTRIKHMAALVTRDMVNKQYHLASDILNSAGFSAPVGKNTFSRQTGHNGVSQYLTERVQKGRPYLGIGLGAQSWTGKILQYNAGAASKTLDTYKRMIDAGQLPVQDLYHLSKQAAMGKMIAVSFYFGGIDRTGFAHLFNCDLYDTFRSRIDFLLQHELVTWEGSSLRLTQAGIDCFGGVVAQFYAPAVQKVLLENKCLVGPALVRDDVHTPPLLAIV